MKHFWPVLAGLVLSLLALTVGWPVRAQGEQPPTEPVALGAWLYSGNCVSCHGPMDKTVAGLGLDIAELEDAITGNSRQGCVVAWSVSRGGTLTSKQISSLAAFIQAWGEQGGLPALPPLPPYPTPTPYRVPTPRSGHKPPAVPTTAPQVGIDPQVQLAIAGNPIAQGAWLYTQNCYRCHLDYSFGRMGIGLSRERIKRTISNGKTGTSMPAFSLSKGGVLKAQEINAIVTYILAWEQLEESPALPAILLVPPTPDPRLLVMILPPASAAVQGEARRGGELFAQHCAACHGLFGEGGIAPTLRRLWYSQRPDLTIFGAIANGVPGSIMPAWKQTAGGPVSEQDIADLTVLLLEWSTESEQSAPYRRAALPSWLWALAGGWCLLLGIGLWRKARR